MSFVRVQGPVVWITKDSRRQFWDVNSFRPDMKEYVRSNRRYPSRITYETQNLPSGKEVQIPKYIKIDGKVFENVR